MHVMGGSRSSGTYLYAVLASERAAPSGYGALGIDGAEVYCLSTSTSMGAVSAAVSRLERPRLRPERKLLMAHNDVLKRLMKDSSVLPAAFGHVARSDAEVLGLLEREGRSLREQLVHVEGKVEMGLRVSWNAPDLYAYFVEVFPELRALRQRMAGRSDVGRDEKIDAGRTFERIREEARDSYFARVESVLVRHGIGVKRCAVRGEREIMNLACLCPREPADLFESAVEEAAAPFDDRFTFDLNGPWAPHNFAELLLSP
jgi:hypothetical protein